MEISNLDRSTILIQALPYIKKLHDKTVVIKYGGNAMVNEELKQAVMTDIVLLSLVGIKVVLVHGGGPEINTMLDRVGIESKFVNGLRHTDADTMEIVQMVLAGKVNKDLVRLLCQNGGRAIGLCGLDSNILQAHKKSEELGFVGEVDSVNVEPINDMLESGYIPVVSTIASGKDVYNVNADTAAAKIAAELHAEKLILMTDIRGLLRDKDDEDTLINIVNVSDVKTLKAQGIISGGMIPKIDCCVETVRRGVPRAHIIDGRIPHSILIELLSDKGVGTMFL